MFKKIRSVGTLLSFFALLFGLKSLVWSQADLTALEKYFRINERKVLITDAKLNIDSEIESLAADIKEYCQDEIDKATGELISEGYFRYTIEKNTLRVEMDQESGYTIGDGQVRISFARKCPGLIGSSLLPKDGTVEIDFKFSGLKQKGSDKLVGNYQLKAKIPPTVNRTGSFIGSVSNNKVQVSFPISIGALGYNVDLTLPFNAELKESKDYRLIKFGVIAEEPIISFLPDYKPELFADGEGEHEFKLSLVTPGFLVNSLNNDQVIDKQEAGLKDEEIELEMERFLTLGTSKVKDWGKVNKEQKDKYELKTDENGEARFVYQTPMIEENEYTDGEVMFRARSKKAANKGGAQGYVILKKGVGEITGRLIDYKGRVLDNDMYVKIKYSDSAPIDKKTEEILVKAKQGKFVIKTKFPRFDYTLAIYPPDHLKDLLRPKYYYKLGYDVDLGDIVIGTTGQLEEKAIEDVKAFLKKAGLLSAVEDHLDNLHFEYDGGLGQGGAYYDEVSNKVVMFGEEIWDNPNMVDNQETIFHELMHAVHVKLAYDDPNWLGKLADNASMRVTWRQAGGSHTMWGENEARWGIDNTQIAFSESIANFMAHMMMTDLGITYRKDADSDTGYRYKMTREEYYLQGSVSDNNKNKTGEIVESKIVAFLIDYYNEKNLSPAQRLQDFFITTRDFQGYSGINNARDINEWVVAKMISNAKEGDTGDSARLQYFMAKHNIAFDQFHQIQYLDTSKTLKDSYEKAYLQNKENQEYKEKVDQLKEAYTRLNENMRLGTDNLKDNQLDKADGYFKEVQKDFDQIDQIRNGSSFSSGDKTADIKIGGVDYQVQPDSSYKLNLDGTVDLEVKGTVVVNAKEASRVTAGDLEIGSVRTKYAVERDGDKVYIRVAEGEVKILNTKTKESYLAKAGEEVLSENNQIKPVRTFDPTARKEFKSSLLDSLSLTTIVIGLGALGLVGLVIKFLNRKK